MRTWKSRPALVRFALIKRKEERRKRAVVRKSLCHINCSYGSSGRSNRAPVVSQIYDSGEPLSSAIEFFCLSVIAMFIKMERDVEQSVIKSRNYMYCAFLEHDVILFLWSKLQWRIGRNSVQLFCTFEISETLWLGCIWCAQIKPFFSTLTSKIST